MTIHRTLTVLSLTFAALLMTGNTAKADKVQDIFRTVRKIQADFGGTTRQAMPRHHGPQDPGFGFPGGGCHKQTCPPPPPPCFEYCVYYYSCHCGWKLYGRYHSQWQASQAEHQLQSQGYRTYIRVKQVGGHHGGPVLYGGR